MNNEGGMFEMVYQHIADEGIGKLFADPDPDKARDHFPLKIKDHERQVNERQRSGQ